MVLQDGLCGLDSTLSFWSKDGFRSFRKTPHRKPTAGLDNDISKEKNILLKILVDTEKCIYLISLNKE
jgi:hypothetical protein